LAMQLLTIIHLPGEILNMRTLTLPTDVKRKKKLNS